MPRPWLRWTRRQLIGWGSVLVAVNLVLSYVVRPRIHSDLGQVIFALAVMVPVGISTFYVIFTWALHWDRTHPRDGA